jgi:ATP-dependent Lon protease
MSDVKDYRAGLVPDILALLPLRGTVLLPHAVLPLGAGRASSVRPDRRGRAGGPARRRRHAARSAGERAGREGLHDVGTVTVIHKTVKQADGSLRLIVQGLGRFRIVEVLEREPFIRARVEALDETCARA